MRGGGLRQSTFFLLFLGLTQKRGNEIKLDSNSQIFPNGSLSIHRVDESDQGDYACAVQNVHGTDRIVYEMIVQIPPIAPEVIIRNSTGSSMELVWMSRRSRKQPILGYSLSYRRSHGDWLHLDCDPLTDSIWLEGLACGTNYSVYMTAYNHVGESVPSTVVGGATRGRVPDIPLMSELLVVNRTLVTIRLDAFGSGGCPISYFVIEYRRDIQPVFQIVANNVSPRDKTYIIRGLEPATHYFVRVSAHNTAG